MSERFKLTTNWQLFLRELGVDPGIVLRRARLPLDLLTRDGASVSSEEYFRFLDGMAEEIGDQPLALEIGQRVSLEAFDPTILAMLCSPDLNVAAERLRRFKKCTGPLTLHVHVNPEETKLEFGCIGPGKLHVAIGMIDLVFMVYLVRRATKSHVYPVRVTVADFPSSKAQYEDFFGVRLTSGTDYSISFSAYDAKKPFLTANAEMWRFFEPVLQKRITEMDREASTTQRVRAALFELLPSGRSSIGDVSKVLGMSIRSIQRHLTQENTTFKQVLITTREQLARHYLSNSKLSAGEIALLLGFDEPNSFSRAFRQWTGQTPRDIRASLS